MKPVDFITDMYRPDDLVALVLVSRDEEKKTQQRIWNAGKAASQQVMKWLRYSNTHGYDIYIGMNPLRPGSRTRNKEDVEEVRRVYADLDEDGPSKLKEVLQDGFSGKIPSASYIINTSPDRYQLIWNVKPGSFTPKEAEALMRGIAVRYGGDRAVTDVSRVLRLPGFKHRGKNTWITMSSTSAEKSEKKDWPDALFTEPDRTASVKRASSSPHRSGGDTSPSGHDWGWTRDRIREGNVTDEELEQQLAAARTDKRDPADYAKRTVARARESLDMEYSR
ncbi:MAG: DNA-primase RepB domain-containing protein [Bryobacterales bacterium]|nr:DNA-primase RepB domain-containing protein [Bryobacterales bacterium]MDE0293023.1 DNA-primase RepB domain-containing protein [Bryobacterales bacterium]